ERTAAEETPSLSGWDAGSEEESCASVPPQRRNPKTETRKLTEMQAFISTECQIIAMKKGVFPRI
ncbi:MAG TPA: hypothetical protein DCR61_08415, partial [Verrucomicrobiales bacterium]|nr:hypothetical protein [Verrucomicrobiales bacterium]